MAKEKKTSSSFKELMGLTVVDLKKEVVRCQKSLFSFRFQKKEGESVKPHEVRNVRKHIARVKTAMTKKFFQEVGGE